MQLSRSLEKVYNDQIKLEFESVYAYLQLSADMERANFPGFAHWMQLQATEEWSHATKFTRFVLDRGGSVTLQPIEAPQSGVNAPLKAFELALQHEIRVTAAIHDLYRLATSEGDYASLPLLQWFVSEQVEEESSVGLIVERLRMVGEAPAGMLLLDRDLGSRAGAA